MKKPVWIAGIARGHNSGVCLLKDGEIVFSIEEERLTRLKYDGGALASILKIKEYTDKLDYMVIAHTTDLETAGMLDYSGEDVYSGLARKIGLISTGDPRSRTEVIDVAWFHHKMHAAMAFYRSGFDQAVAVIVDGAGTFFPLSKPNRNEFTVWETESIYKCNYPANFKTLHKTVGTKEALSADMVDDFPTQGWHEDHNYPLFIHDRAGIVKAYEAVTEYCGFSAIEAGKTMGLSPYGKPNNKIPPVMDKETGIPVPTSNRNLIVPRYPNGAEVNQKLYTELNSDKENLAYDQEDVTYLDNRRDLAYAVQQETQEAVVKLIRHAVETSKCKKVVISGGYGLNCVANYHYLDALKDEGIEIYVEPISNDAGTAMGAALIQHYKTSQNVKVNERANDVFLGPKYDYSEQEIYSTVEKYDAEIKDATHEDVVELMTSKNIVANFQGRSENGPRALGNRSLMFDPTFEDGKDFVNEIKRREYFRPFAGSILEEDAHEWFDLRGMDSSPTMMYAVNCQPGVEEKIPAIIHVDGTCRIQTVSREQNPHYYDIIKTFKEKTGVPIIFNTSFNLGGEPLVETIDDAIRTLATSDINYLYLPEYNKLITVQKEFKDIP
jgi:carbamoyltransferase